jgi:hypothetical protein
MVHISSHANIQASSYISSHVNIHISNYVTRECFFNV